MSRPDAFFSVKSWVEKAEEDYLVAERLLEDTEFHPYGAIAFHSQQCAEKLIKALLTHQRVQFPKTHDIEFLLDIVGSFNETLACALREAAKLSIYGIVVRYPDLPEIDAARARKSFELAGLVRNSLLPLLRSELEI
jgi:HEPN domain-containing protein